MLRAWHEPYERGLYRVGDVQLYVNRGIGNSGLRVRVNSAPEVTLATLRAPHPSRLHPARAEAAPRRYHGDRRR